MDKKPRLNAEIINSQFGLQILAEHLPFKILKRIFMDYKLVLSSYNLFHREYEIKGRGETIGSVEIYEERRFPAGSTVYYVSPSVTIWIYEKYKDEILKSLQERFEIKIQDQKSDRKCPECDGELVYAPTSTTCIEGTGQTYSQHMRPYNIPCDIVCSQCGLVVGKSVHKVHR